MKVQNAYKLHNEDEVKVKKTKEILRVVKTEVVFKDKTKEPERVYILLEDGNWYNHKDIS